MSDDDDHQQAEMRTNHDLTSVFRDPAPGVSWRDYVDQRWAEQHRALEKALAAVQREQSVAHSALQLALNEHAKSGIARLDENARLNLERMDVVRREAAAASEKFDAIIDRVTATGSERLEGIRREVDVMEKNLLSQVADSEKQQRERTLLLAAAADRDRGLLEKALAENAKHSDERTRAVRAEAEAVRAGADRAITKSEEAAEKRFQSVNEFRAQLQDQQNATAKRDSLLVSQLMPREVAEAQLKELAKQVTQLQARIDKNEGHGSGINASLGVALTLLGFLIIIAIAVANYLASH